MEMLRCNEKAFPKVSFFNMQLYSFEIRETVFRQKWVRLFPHRHEGLATVPGCILGAGRHNCRAG